VRSILAQCLPIKLESQVKITFPVSGSEWHTSLGRNRGKLEFRKGMEDLLNVLIGESDVEAALRAGLEPDNIRSTEPWMSDIICFGNSLLIESKYKKVQNYYDAGVFLFFGENARTYGDILLGPIAVLRNRLIQFLACERDSLWEFEWGSVETHRVLIENYSRTVFFKGHTIKLIKKEQNVFCQFDYKNLSVGELTNSDLTVFEMPYPEDGSLSGFKDSLGKSRPPKILVEVLDELLLACELLPKLV